jgi:hypothetical protein
LLLNRHEINPGDIPLDRNLFHNPTYWAQGTQRADILIQSSDQRDLRLLVASQLR